MSTIEYRTFEGPPGDELVASIVTMSEELFGPGSNAAELRASLQGKQQIYACLAFQEGRPVGYKLGYMQRAHYFESWRGGVLPSARRKGIAGELQRMQHKWCKAQGFRILTTITDGHNAPMLILNLQHGFTIVGTVFDRGQHLKVVLQKRLDADG